MSLYFYFPYIPNPLSSASDTIHTKTAYNDDHSKHDIGVRLRRQRTIFGPDVYGLCFAYSHTPFCNWQSIHSGTLIAYPPQSFPVADSFLHAIVTQPIVVSPGFDEHPPPISPSTRVAREFSMIPSCYMTSARFKDGRHVVPQNGVSELGKL